MPDLSQLPDLATMLAFIAASLVIIVIPGPTIALVVARSLSDGHRVALPMVLGVGLGDLVASAVALAGAGAILSASATAFVIVKALGAAYLIWLGLKLLFTTPKQIATSNLPGGSRLSAFRDLFLVTVFNPKGILFFTAFVPQFIDPAKNYGLQAAAFVLCFATIGLTVSAIYALAARTLRRVLRNPLILGRVNKAAGLGIITTGVVAFFARRPAT